jgi:glutathione S-transferase
MPEYQLYWAPGTCARVPFVALLEIGEPYEIVVVNRFSAADNGYSLINPKGKVPALVVGNRTITENPAIETFLARRHPEAALLPHGDETLEIEALELMSWFASGIHPWITRLRFPRLTTSETAAHDSIRATACAQLEGSFAILEKRLQGRDWLFGAWTIVDAYLLWLWFRATGSGMPGSQFPLCAAHAARCEARPSVAAVLDREEQEWARVMQTGGVPPGVPPFQVGRSPSFVA